MNQQLSLSAAAPLGGLLVLALMCACEDSVSGGAPDVNTTSTSTSGGDPVLVVNVTNVNFGEVELGTVASASIDLQNAGSGVLELLGLEISGTEFSATAGAGLQISAGATTSIGLKYLPADYVDDQGTLTLTTNESSAEITEITLVGGVVTDADGDGHDSEAAGGDDCNDDNADVYPGHADEFYDGIDSNCDGTSEYDQDGDGYESEVYNDDPDLGGGDCQDANADMHPGADDSWYDGIDSDCDGSDDFDQDGDGYGSADHGQGRDCDDSDPETNPENAEVFNGLDDDCNGEVDDDINGEVADLVYYGVTAGDYAGHSVTMGDLDADGRDDLVVGSYNHDSGYGMVSLFDGTSLPSTGSDMQDGVSHFTGDGPVYLGWELTVLEPYGTEAHLAVGAPGASNNGTIYVIPGSVVMSGNDTSQAVLTISGGSAYNVGRGLAQDLDLDGDGSVELLGNYQDSSSDGSTQQLWLMYGGVNGIFSVDSNVDARFTTDDGTHDNMVGTFPSGGDIDGDGYDDFVYCDDLVDHGETNTGAVWALWGGATQYSNGSAESLDSAGTVLSSGDNYGRHGFICAIGDDLDGDGAAEVWVVEEGQEQRWLYVMAGGTDFRSGGVDPEEVSIATYQIASSDPSPIALRQIGDWTGDGVSEMAMGLENSSTKAGQVWIYSSEVLDFDLDADQDALGVIEGEDDEDEGYYQEAFGARISSRPGDLDGNGNPDLVVGDYLWGASDDYDGGVWISFSAD